MGFGERLSIRARLRISILSLVAAIVIALSALHVFAVMELRFSDVGDRGAAIAEAVNSFVVDTVNHSARQELTPIEVVRSNTGIQAMLRRSLSRSSAVLDVMLLDGNSRVISAADPERIGRIAPPSRRWQEWRGNGLLWQLLDMFRSHSNLAIDAPIGTATATAPLMNVRVLISPALLRDALEPQLRSLFALSAFSLAISAFLAILVSRLVGNSLERLGHKIDLIARGDMQSVQEDRFQSPELIDIDTKLSWLGRQYTGARSDIVNLKSSVEQMLRQVDQAVFLFGPDGRLQIAGEAAERLLARPRSELLGRTVQNLFPEWTGAGSAISRAIASRVWLRDERVTLERPNLPSANLLATVEPVEYDGGPATGTMIVLRDADGRNGGRTDTEAARRLVALSRITSGVAHEIKNPLNAMMLHLEIASEKARTERDNGTELGIVKSELMRLNRVVNTLLEFHKPVDVRLVECDLAPIAREIAALLRPQAEGCGVKVCLDVPDHVFPVLADVDLLKQCVLNVAINGIEAMTNGGNLTISVRRVDRDCVLTVEDEGPGIPAEIRDQVFNLYFTTKKTGSGIGLAMAYRIMQLHAGSITIESEGGKGSRCHLALPSRESKEAAA